MFEPRSAAAISRRLAQIVAAAVIALSQAVAAAQTPPQCAELDAATRETVLRRAARQLRIEPSVPILDRESLVPGTCYRQLFLSSAELRRGWIVYLSPDKRFLSLGLIDLSVDPRETDALAESALDRFIAHERPPQRGPDSAPVTAVVFSDFQCPYCAKVTMMLDRYRKQSPGQVREIYGNFPLPSHNWAAAAARSGICIARQDAEAFWRFHDLLLATQTAVTTESLQTFAEQFAASDRRLDPARYQDCMVGSYPDARLQADLAAARSLEVHSTPTVFLNGRRYTGFADEPALASAIRLAAAAAVPKETEKR